MNVLTDDQHQEQHLLEMPTQPHTLQCTEIWSGHRSAENKAHSTGLEAWVFSQPFHGDSNGGDVHYFSLCAGGIVTRMVLADVSGHGDKVAKTSAILRALLRQFMNSKRQDKLVAQINREFTALEQNGRFATAVVATYLSHKRTLLMTNAGHPTPLMFRKQTHRWQFVSEASMSASDTSAATASEAVPSNLPFGIESSTTYSDFKLTISDGDILILYTDAFTEAMSSDGTLLGEAGLMNIVEQLPTDAGCDDIGRCLRQAIADYTSGHSSDDETVIVLKFGRGRRSPGITERLRGYVSVLFGESKP